MTNFAYADEPVIDLTNKPINQPTLDYLKENNILIPQKDYQRDEDGNIVKVNDKPVYIDAEPILSPGSAYTLTQVDLEGDNIITKYILNEETKDLVPQYFCVDLKKTTYGEGSQVKSYEWSTDSDGNRTFSEVTTPTEGKTTIEFRYNPDSYSKVYDNEANLELIDTVSTSDVTYKYYAGGALKVKEGETTSIVDTLFINNKAITDEKNSSIYGGALYNAGNIEDIVADFIGNSSDSGGAIYNKKGTIGNITGNFIGNSGGAINNTSGTIGNITGDFIGNYGTAISNGGTIENIIGDFIGNYDVAIHNGRYNYPGAIGNITGDFIGNYGVAIYIEYGSIGNITGDFIGNYGGAIHHTSSGTIGNIIGDFIGNYGIAIYVEYGTIGNIKGDFIGNSSDSVGAIVNSRGTIGNIAADFVGNSVTSVDAAYGGAIANEGTIGAQDSSGNVIGGIINSNFYDNSAVASSQEGLAFGGAIVTVTDLNIIADNGSSTFKGNYVQVADGEKDYQAIYVGFPGEVATSNLNFISRNNGVISMYDNINGEKGYMVNITGDNTGVFNLYNDIYNANVNLGNTTISTINNDIHAYNFDSFTLTNDAKMLVDVDLKNRQMDRITAYDKETDTHNYGTHNGTLTVSGMNLISDAPVGQDVTEILFADPGLKDNVANGVTTETPTTYQTTAYTPIYRYAVNYNNKDDGGYFEFTRGGKYIPPTDPSNPGGVVIPPTNPSDNFNPAVLDSPVASRAGAQSAVSETVRFAFQHMDAFSQLPFSERMAIIHNNQYAINDTEATPHYNTDLHQGATKGYWIRPYTSFEKINLHNGPDVDAITYGTLVGLDSNFKPLKHGWYNVQSVYAGYNGSSLSYSGVDTTLNGGVLGLTETFYKNNFFTALTATAGASMATGSTMYGNEDYAMLVGGVGAKGGYNFEFKGGKYILQPIMFANYSFVNTFDYTNAAGVKMTSTPLHTLQLNPQLKFVSNLKNGWQPYASVGVVWNVLNTSKVKANDVILPRMTVDPYVEYGLGLQRNWKDKYTGFAQAMVRNGGRNGVALTFGFRWALGKEAL